MSIVSAIQQKAQTMWSAKFEFIIQVQCEFGHEYDVRPPDDKHGNGTSNLKRRAVWKEDVLLGSLGDLMKMWIVLDRLSHGVHRSQFPKQVQSYRCHKSISQTSTELQMPQVTAHKIL
jgi:hypothetical protein